MEIRHSEHIASQLCIMREPVHNCEFKQQNCRQVMAALQVLYTTTGKPQVSGLFQNRGTTRYKEINYKSGISGPTSPISSRPDEGEVVLIIELYRPGRSCKAKACVQLVLY